MKVKSCQINNFGSYKTLYLDFSQYGLTLLHGATGSGKSTIPDMVFWVLFGETAKGGSVDDIRSWQGGGPTIGTLEVDLGSETLLITRVRGKTSENDLYWVSEGGSDPIRGKDLKDTQRLLEAKLGVSALLYEVGAYFHEFSPITNFFLVKAKDRRAIFEQIADLSLPKRLAEQATVKKKLLKDGFESINTQLAVLRGKIEQIEGQIERAHQAGDIWKAQQAMTIASLKAKSSAFELHKTMKTADLENKSIQFEKAKQQELDAAKEQLEALLAIVKPPGEVEGAILKLKHKINELGFAKCEECGGPKESPLRDKYLDQIATLQSAAHINERNVDKLESVKSILTQWTKRENPFTSQIEDLKTKTDTYADMLRDKEKEVNPYEQQENTLIEEQLELSAKADIKLKEGTDTAGQIAMLTKLYDLSFDLRGCLLQNVVRQVQDKTNRHLETYFDGELRTNLTLEGADSLQVELYKSGYNCGYKQLSKGQRGLLKLCFSIAIMEAAANQSGIHFDTLFLDEALDGLDTGLKIRAYDLMQELQKTHSTVFVVEHNPEFQSLFDNQIHITMIEDNSQVDTDHSTPLNESEDDKEGTGTT